MRYLVFIIALFAALQTNAQNNIVYGAGINYTNGAPTFTPPVRTSRVAIDTVTGRWYHFNTPGGWQLIGNTIEEIAGCTAPAYTPGKGDSKVVINNCSPQPELYFYNGSAWVLVGGGSVYAGEGIRIENDTIILDSLYILRFRTGSNTDGAAGAMSWNATEETVDLVTDQGAVTGHLMESAYYNTRNTTGSSIVVGTVVMANGTTGNTGRILIAPAIANGTVNSEYILGLAAQTIGNNSNGKVQHFGKIRGIQTNGANYGETWVDGDVLYCSSATPGYLTKVLPTAPNLKVPIAIVIHAHPSNGTLFVRPSHFPDLAQINDVQLSSPTNGQVLTYNSTLSRWENATPANQLQTLSTDGSAGNISISSGNTITLNVNDADASATNELQTLSTGTNTLTLSNGGGTVTVDTDPADDVTGSGANTRVAFWDATKNIASNSNFIFNGSTASGNSGLIVGAIQFNGFAETVSNTGAGFAAAGFNRTLRMSGGNNNNASDIAGVIINAGTVNNRTVSTAFQGVRFTSDVQGASSTLTSFTMLNSSPRIRFGVTTYTGYDYDPTFDVAPTNHYAAIFRSGRVGIGASTPGANLEVRGSGTSSSTWTAQFHNSGGANNALMIRDDGRVAMGTNAPNASAILTVTSTTGGILFPRMTTTERNAIATPADGLVIYNTTDNKLQVRAGGAWVDLH